MSGIIYSDDKNMIIDPVKGIEYLKEKAKSGDVEASYILGKILFDIDDEYSEHLDGKPYHGIKYQLFAEEKGHSGAKKLLERIYEKGFEFTYSVNVKQITEKIAPKLIDWKKTKWLDVWIREFDERENLKKNFSEALFYFEGFKKMSETNKLEAIKKTAKILSGDELISLIEANS